jgi:glycosyltransferase involved in cell wall biosynthesis
MDIGGGIMKKKVIVKGPALSASGYGEHARLVLRALKSREDLFDIYFANIEWGKTGWISEDTEERRWLDELVIKTHAAMQNKTPFDLSLQVTIPNEFQKLAPVNIGVTAGIETHKVAPEWLQKVNEMDKIITISEHSKRGFTETKYPLVNDKKEHVADLTCNVPVEVVGYPVKTIEPADAQFDFDTDFNFLTVALWGQRKNLEQTIRAFVEQFRDNDNVGLILKTAFKNGSTYDKMAMHNTLSNISKKYGERKCKIYLLHGRLSEAEMTTLLNHDKVKCMFSIAHGEGFGLPLFEAAYNGLPIVTTDWSGHLDFLYVPQKDKKGKEKKKGMFGKVSYDLNNVQKESVWKGVIVPDSKWAYPSLQSAKTKIADVYKDYDLALNKAKKLKEHVLSEFEESKILEKLVSSFSTEDREKEARDVFM